MRSEKNCLVVLSFLLVASGCASVSRAPESSIDLSTPESTVVGFTRAAAAGHGRLARAYLLPGSLAYEDTREMLTAKRSTPGHAIRMVFESIDTKAPMPMLKQEEKERGVDVVWQVTFAKACEIQGKRLEIGDTGDLDATLVRTERGWQIVNF